MSVKDIDLFSGIDRCACSHHVKTHSVAWRTHRAPVYIIEQVSTTIVKYGTPLHLLQTLVA